MTTKETKKPHILLDMDGVLANFVGGCEQIFEADLSELDQFNIREYLNQQRSQQGKPILTAGEFWGRIENSMSFWAKLPVYPWARDLVNLCREKTGGMVTIATSPSMSASCSAQKTHWIGSKFPGLVRRLMIGPQKHLMAKKNHILIDDSDNNIEKFKEHGGQAITFPQKWNKVGYTIEEVSEEGSYLSYIEEKIDAKLENIVQ